MATIRIHGEVVVGPSTEDPHAGYPLAVVGVSHYQDALRDIVETSADPGPNWPFHGAQCEVMAQLIPEKGNRYDPMAVRVDIQNRCVGYLSREEARKYRRVLEAIPVPTKALIIGGWDHTNWVGRKPEHTNVTGQFGVRLAWRIEERRS